MRLILSVVDQAACSLSTVVLTFATLYLASSATDFGFFALAYAGVVLALNFGRYVSLTPFILSLSNVASSRGQASDAVSLSFLLGLGVAVSTLPIGLALEGSKGAAVTALIVSLPAYLAQDASRGCLVAMRRPLHALVLDSLLLVVQCIGTILFFMGDASMAGPAIAFSAGAWASFLWSVFSHARIRVSAGSRHLRTNASLLPSLSLEFLVTSGTRASVPVLVGLSAGLAEAGRFRASESVIGLANVVLMGLSTFLAAEFVRSKSDRHRTGVLMRSWAAGSAVLLALLYVFILATWEQFWLPLLGETSPEAKRTIAALAVAIFFNQQVAARLMVLRANLQVRKAALVRILGAPIVVLLVLLGSLARDAFGASIGLAVSYMVVLSLITLRTGGPRGGVLHEKVASDSSH